MQRINNYELKFREIPQDIDVDEAVINMEGGPYQEYFYIKIPTLIGQSVVYRHFCYVPEEKLEENASNITTKFPFQLGHEIAAEIMGDISKSNWKNNLLDETQESELAIKFREEFKNYDFTMK